MTRKTIVSDCIPAYEKPECVILVFDIKSEVLQSSVESWGEEDLIENE